MRELTIEKYLIKEVKAVGGMCIKLGGYVGIPDRMVILPNNIILFVELKTPIGRLTPLQQRWKSWLEKMGCVHLVIRDQLAVNRLIVEYFEKEKQ